MSPQKKLRNVLDFFLTGGPFYFKNRCKMIWTKTSLMAECTELLRSTLRVLVFVFAGCVFVFAGCVFVLAVFGGVHWEPLSPSYHSSLPHQAYPSRQLQSDRDRVPLFATDRSPHFHLWCISRLFPLALSKWPSKQVGGAACDQFFWTKTCWEFLADSFPQDW